MGPVESTMAVQVRPSLVVCCIPSAVATHVVSRCVTIPDGATYCHSGPSSWKVQFRHVRPPSIDTPHPLPIVPYQICPRGPKAMASRPQDVNAATIGADPCPCARIGSHLEHIQAPSIGIR
jgi:hypothetical protein